MLDGARLFVASYPLRDSQVAHVWRNAFYTLMWLQGGLATLTCDGERFEVAPLSLVCVAPGQVYWWDGPDPDVRVIQLGFLPDIFTAGVLDVHLLTDLPLFSPDGTTVLVTRDAVSRAIDVLFAQILTRYLESADQQALGRWRVLPAHREGLLLAYLHAILAEAATLDLPEYPLRPAQTAPEAQPSVPLPCRSGRPAAPACLSLCPAAPRDTRPPVAHCAAGDRQTTECLAA